MHRGRGLVSAMVVAAAVAWIVLAVLSVGYVLNENRSCNPPAGYGDSTTAHRVQQWMAPGSYCRLDPKQDVPEAAPKTWGHTGAGRSPVVAVFAVSGVALIGIVAFTRRSPSGHRRTARVA